MLQQEKLVNINIAQRLRKHGFNETCDYAYVNCTGLSEKIQEEYPNLTDDGYYDLTKEGGGELDWNIVYPKQIRIVQFYNKNNSDAWWGFEDDYIASAPTLEQVILYFESEYNYIIDVFLEKYDENGIVWKCIVYNIDGSQIKRIIETTYNGKKIDAYKYIIEQILDCINIF